MSKISVEDEKGTLGELTVHMRNIVIQATIYLAIFGNTVYFRYFGSDKIQEIRR